MEEKINIHYLSEIPEKMWKKYIELYKYQKLLKAYNNLKEKYKELKQYDRKNNK